MDPIAMPSLDSNRRIADQEADERGTQLIIL